MHLETESIATLPSQPKAAQLQDSSTPSPVLHTCCCTNVSTVAQVTGTHWGNELTLKIWSMPALMWLNAFIKVS